MKFKKYIILLLTLFIGFGFVSRVEALTVSEYDKLDKTEQNDYLSGLSSKEREEFQQKYEKYLAREQTKENQSNNSTNGSWCTKFNNIWYVFGIIIQVIYVVTPLLLIISGSITMIQAMMKHDPGAVTKAQKALVNKIIAAVVVFLMISIVKMVTALVADDGWVSCANCAFNPNQSNCEIEKVQTGQ